MAMHASKAVWMGSLTNQAVVGVTLLSWGTLKGQRLRSESEVPWHTNADVEVAWNSASVLWGGARTNNTDLNLCIHPLDSLCPVLLRSWGPMWIGYALLQWPSNPSSTLTWPGCLPHTHHSCSMYYSRISWSSNDSRWGQPDLCILVPLSLSHKSFYHWEMY